MSWFGRLFRRSRPPRPAEPLREDWAPGDLAVCIADRWPGHGPVCGQVCRVLAVRYGKITAGADIGDYAFGLVLAGFDDAYFANNFRKVRPELEPADIEFTEVIRRLKPVRERVQ